MMIRRLPALLALFTAFLSSPLHAEDPKADVKMGAYYGGKSAEYPAWFKNSFLNLKEDIADAHKSGKRVMLMFTQDNCPYCSALVERNLSQRQIETTLKEKFDVIAINIWGDREVVGLDGKTYTEKSYSAAQKIQFTPSLFFFDEKGNTILRLNGYVPPPRMQAALDWVSGHQEHTSSFRDFVAAREAPKQSVGEMISEDFFLKKTSDLQRRSKQPKPLAVFFEQKDCPDCEVLHRRVLADPETRSVIAKFDNVQLDMWSRDMITTPAGKKMSVRNWVKQLGVNYAPGIVLFDPAGKEVIRWESSFRVFHTLGMFDYVVTGDYLKEPNFQRFLGAKTEHIREAGRDVNIWRYADEPITTKAQ
ncbi:MAG: thioredoxin fold domain-containing protein [Sulfuriferula multivorans]|uniref:Thioredoxin fold domain-containing protein n=1 Tax=Sulfuriferula multivorans TaxID=1559896 RepID=A0A7C9K955_9PROT|nr:thioredoxin fold domain-containing protein [Sulfuriferula multivorans]